MRPLFRGGGGVAGAERQGGRDIGEERVKASATGPGGGPWCLGSGVWLCCGAMMCLAIAVNLPPVYLTTFSEVFGGPGGLTAEQLGRIPAFLFTGLVLGIVAAGPLADRWGARLFALLGLALTGAGLAFMGLAGSYPTLLAAAALMGLGAGVLDMVLSPIVCALVPHRRTAALNWLHSFYCTGALLTVLVGSWALHRQVSWRTVVFGVITFPAALLAGFLWMRVPPLVAAECRRVPVAGLMRSTFFLACLGAIALAGAAEQGAAQWLPAFAEKGLGYTKSAGALVLAGFLFAMAVGRMLSALVGDRIRPVRLLRLACAAAFCLTLAGSLLPRPAAAAAACVAVGLAVSCLWPTMLAVGANRFPHGGASMFALLAAFGNAGCTVMPWIVGLVAGHAGLRWGLASVAVCPALLAGLLLWLDKMPPPKDE